MLLHIYILMQSQQGSELIYNIQNTLDPIQRHIPSFQPQCYVIGSSKRTRWEPQTWRSTQSAFDQGLGGGGGVEADPLIKPSFNLKKGLWRVTTGVPMLSSWPLPLEGGCYGIQASRVQSAPKAHLTHTLPWWWPDLKAALHCFSTWLCACFP